MIVIAHNSSKEKYQFRAGKDGPEGNSALEED